LKETLKYAIESGKTQGYYTELSKMLLIGVRENENCAKKKYIRLLAHRALQTFLMAWLFIH
jgi:hypothetical protein